MYIWIFIVPILVKVLEKIGDTAHVTIFEYTFEAQLSLPFSWSIFYASALTFATANLIFFLRCPTIIKEQKDYAEFRNANKGVEHLDSYLFEVGMNWEGLRLRIGHQDEYLNEVADALNPSADDGLLRKRFWAVYAQANLYRKFSRNVVASLYGVGGALISYVVIQNAYYVAVYLWC